ncbi:cytochrome b-c1 complex subunit 8 [Pterulicium gracile]|uniref:Cytochrome b-c1 complex subunit 8 n=1 Tax=Pterulicium gracile TaxID=1884261 RepID=A0A5C3QQK0_9AGAR|nr:cytochrome b-c1 complex subunit 8 [Pterula gracilis]
MRPSASVMSEMPGGKVYNEWWGVKTSKQKGIYSYTLSPYQSKAAPNWARNYLFNGYRRISGEVIFWVVPFTLGYGIYTWANKHAAYLDSKQAHIAGEGGH